MNKKAFTLIELLVVVLIIGILAAVALPQYQKAVIKARVGTMLPVLKTVAQAQQAYFLSNNSYATDATLLDVAMPGNCSETTGDEFSEGRLWKCGNDFLVDFSPYPSYIRIYANYCPGYNTSWETCAPKRDFQIYVQINNTHEQTWNCAVLNGSSLGSTACNMLQLNNL